jgi:hypothetical protein
MDEHYFGDMNNFEAGDLTDEQIAELKHRVRVAPYSDDEAFQARLLLFFDSTKRDNLSADDTVEHIFGTVLSGVQIGRELKESGLIEKPEIQNMIGNVNLFFRKRQRGEDWNDVVMPQADRLQKLMSSLLDLDEGRKIVLKTMNEVVSRVGDVAINKMEEVWLGKELKDENGKHRGWANDKLISLLSSGDSPWDPFIELRRKEDND